MPEPLFVINSEGLKIAIRHRNPAMESVVIVAPGILASKNSPVFRKIEDELSPYFAVISMDFRGHGDSEGKYTYSALEKEDLKAVIDHAASHHRKIGVLGFSYGAAIAVIQTAEYRNVDSLICVASPMANEEIEFKWWRPEALRLAVLNYLGRGGFRSGSLFLKKTRPIDIVSSLSPVPILFLHGADDATVYPRHSHRLFETAREPKHLRIFDKAGHAHLIYEKHPSEFIRTVREWFQKTLID